MQHVPAPRASAGGSGSCTCLASPSCYFCDISTLWRGLRGAGRPQQEEQGSLWLEPSPGPGSAEAGAAPTNTALALSALSPRQGVTAHPALVGADRAESKLRKLGKPWRSPCQAVGREELLCAAQQTLGPCPAWHCTSLHSALPSGGQQPVLCSQPHQQLPAFSLQRC